jgi:exodeoxyribonuclease V alpha subunit
MHRGPAGAGVLNERLQAALTPAREGLAERRFGGRVYRVGDKVMQLRNNYDKGTAGVFNGSVGQVTAISLEDQELRVLLDEDEEVGYGFDELDELTHAYAVSIHRSQGSEYPCVVVPVTTSAWLMLQRNLLYTAVTRARRIVVLVGSRRALAKAVRTQGAGRRHTALTERLQQRRARTVAVVSRAARLQQVPVELEERIRDRVRPAGRSGRNLSTPVRQVRRGIAEAAPIGRWAC